MHSTIPPLIFKAGGGIVRSAVFQRGQMTDYRGDVCSLTITHYFMIHLGKEEIFIFIIQTTENQVQQNISGQLRICIHSGIEKKK